MDETMAAAGGTGEKAPEPAAPAQETAIEKTPAKAGGARADKGTRDEDARYAAARRRAEAERDAAIARMEGELRDSRGRLDAERQRTVDERARLVADAQVREIGRLDGDIRSLDDLMDMPEYEDFYALVKKGVSLVEAYKLTRYDKLMERAAQAASRQTMRSVGSRQHLTAVAGQPGTGEYVSVPAEVAAEYRLAKPGITDEEIRRKYRRYQKYPRQ